MKERDSGQKLRSEVTCKPINNPCMDLAKSALVDSNVQKFLLVNAKFGC